MEENQEYSTTVLKTLETRRRPRRRSPSTSDESTDEEDFGEAKFVDYDVVVYQSARYAKYFFFKKCVPGGSTLIAGGFEFCCLDCDALEPHEDVRVTVKNGRFVWMDPDEPDRPHKCVPKNAGDTRSEGSAKRPTTSSENAEKRRMKATASSSKQGSDSPSNVSNTPTAYRQALRVAGESLAQGGENEVDDDVIFVAEVFGSTHQMTVTPVAVKEEAREPPTQNVASIGLISGLNPQDAQERQRQASKVPHKRVTTLKTEVAEEASRVPVTAAHGSTGGANEATTAQAAGNSAPLPSDPSYGFKPVFGRAVPTGPTSVTFEGFLGTFTFELAKEGSQIVDGVRVPFKMYRCRECIKVMDRVSHKRSVPCVIVVNGSFVERDPEFPADTEHFCSQDAAIHRSC